MLGRPYAFANQSGRRIVLRSDFPEADSDVRGSTAGKTGLNACLRAAVPYTTCRHESVVLDDLYEGGAKRADELGLLVVISRS
jgi:hypothetical protein